MRNALKYIIVFVAAAQLLISCQSSNGRPNDDFRETFSNKDSRPFGGKVAFDILQNAYPQKYVNLAKKKFSDNYEWHFDSSSVYVNISNYFYADDEDAESLLEFVSRGNTAFISSAYIDTALMNKIYCKQQTNFATMTTGGVVRNTSVDYQEHLHSYKDSLSYFYYPFDNYFPLINDNYGKIVGYNDSDSANFFVFFWGKGRLYLHAEPRAFSNYFLLSKDNYRYMQEFMQILPENPETVYWDDFYNKYNFKEQAPESSGNSIKGLFDYISFSRGLWILIVLLLLYIFFSSKRKQRIIPVTKPVVNNSIAFAEAIAGLYLNKKDNKLIAEKMVTYFNEHMRSKYFITMGINDKGYADMLSRKTGVSFEAAQKLTIAMQMIPAAHTVTDQELLTLNGLIEQFIKLRN